MSAPKHFCIAAATALLTAHMACAADNELYDEPPPDDAAFLRWIEAGQAPDVLGVSALGTEGDLFHPVSAANTAGAAAGVFYTAARDASGDVVVIEEPSRNDRSKVLLTLLNLAGEPVRLVLVEQDVEVVGATDVNAAGGRSVNPVSVSLSVMTASGDALGTFDVQLRRGQNVTFVARPDGAELIENRFGPNLEG